MTSPRSFREAFTEDPADVKDRARLVEERDSARRIAVALEAENARLAAENKQLTDDYVPMVSNDFLTITDGVPQITMVGAREIVARMSESMSMMLDEAGAENYIEMDAKTAGGKTLTLRVQRGEKPTPHQLRQQAERERDAALAELVELRAALTGGGDDARP